ncbi:hypothetical protein GTZ78_12695 [Streptomyces sp. SID8361]|uniref:hypothetical protein n=1 Tax=Streptomyces sp. MnatMP-M27 TaxID=1839768 RepID=UPI00081E0B76|nr:hypothetical protein [Streptomyces sp. MnatMP-M27]MYU11538.1 hypothetical protein [Streptomyces sp. SID8361]SCF82436.1 hypothetical protein GA0115260_1028958 [Streptomyces sp. MnatMP-M27]
MSDLPYKKLPDGKADVDEQTLVTAFAEAEIHCELAGDERFCILAHDNISWIVVNVDHLSTVTADETGSGIRITRTINRSLTPGELRMFDKVMAYHGCP